MKNLSSIFEQTLDEALLTEAFITDAAITWITYKFVIMLKRPFKKWDAYKYGLIDEDGKVTKDAKTSAEKSALSPVMNFIRKVKRMIHKVLPGAPVILPALVAMYLITEGKTCDTINLKDHLISELTEPEILLFDKIILNLKDGISDQI